MMDKLSPPEHLSLDGNTAIAWKKWKQRFQIFITASGLSKKSAEVQTSVLLHAIGPDALDVFNTFEFDEEGDQMVLSIVLEKFEQHFVPKQNLTYERHKFFTRNQEIGETIDQYVTELRTLAKTCEFDALCESLIKDRLVCGIIDNATRARLLRISDLNLEVAIDTCRASEASTKQMKELNETTEKGLEEVRMKDTKQKLKNAHGQSAKARARAHPEKSQQKPNCSRCGRVHPPKTCPAFDKTCNKCKKRGHFAAVCRTKQIQSLEMDEEFFIGSVVTHDKSKNVWNAELVTNSKRIVYKLDTGAQVNVLPRNIYEQFTDKPELKATGVKLLSFGSTKPMPVDGKCICEFEYKAQKFNLEVFVVPMDAAQPVLGLNSCTRLGLIKRVHAFKPLIGTEGSDPTNATKHFETDEVFKDYTDLFKGSGKLYNVEYKIQLKDDATPYTVHTPRRVKLPLMEKVKKALEKMVEQEVIVKVTRPTDWVSPMVPVPKDGTVRVCVDLTELNKAVKKEQFQIPVAEELFAKLQNAKYFTKLDAEAGFWQIPLDEESSFLTTFITPFGRYRFTRLPFGITSGPEVFQSVMRHLLAGTEGNECIIDDILVWGETQKQHDDRLRQVLEKCKEEGLKLNAKKCEVRKKEINFFGHTCSEQGLKVTDEKVKAIQEMEVPQNKQELRRFMGMLAFLAKFLPNYSTSSAPLRELLKDDTSWFWSFPQQKAWEELKQLVTKAPVLAYYDPSAQTVVSADASSFGLGAVLLQVQPDGREAPVAYASRSLNTSEQRYAQIEKEALAMTWACEKFDRYLIGRDEPFEVQTDHKPLVSIMNKQDIDECPLRVQRLKLRMMKFHFQVVYVPGKQLSVADTLSRQPVEKPAERDELEEAVDAYVCGIQATWSASDKGLERLKQETQRDPELTEVQELLMTGWPDTSKKLSSRVQPYWAVRHHLSQENGLVLKGGRIVIPKAMRSEMIQKAHEGHQGITKTKSRAREQIWWPGMNQQLEQAVVKCTACAQYGPVQRKEPLLPSSLPARPWERVAADLFELQGVHYLVVTDYYSRYPEVKQLTDTRSKAVITVLKGIFARHGIPLTVVSDNGPQFDSNEFRKFAEAYEFIHVTSSPRYPQANGQAEKTVQIIENMFKKAKAAGDDPYLALLLYRTTAHEVTGVAPALLLMGRNLRSTLPATPTHLEPQKPDPQKVREADRAQKAKQARYFNQRNSAKHLPELNPGDRVLLRDKRKNEWNPAGAVLKKTQERSYIVQTSSGQLRRNRHQLKRAVLTPHLDPEQH